MYIFIHIEDLSFLSRGGRTLNLIREKDMESVRHILPHVVILMVGGNDLGDPAMSTLKYLIQGWTLSIRRRSTTVTLSWRWKSPSPTLNSGDCLTWITMFILLMEFAWGYYKMYRAVRGAVCSGLSIRLRRGKTPFSDKS